VKTYGTCLRGEYLEVELERVQEIFGDFFPRLRIHFAQHAGPQPLIGLTNILTFKSIVVSLILSPEALWCARHPEDRAQWPVRRSTVGASMRCTCFHSGEKVAPIFSPKTGRVGRLATGLQDRRGERAGRPTRPGVAAKIHTHPR
jgi:hypothetical protein